MMADPPRRQPSVYSIAWAFYLLIAVVGLIWLGFQNGRLHLGIFLDPATWLVDLALGLAAGGAVAGVWTLGVRRWTPLRELESELGRVLGPLRREEALALALISGLAEEMLFRGAVQAAWGWVAASLLFALVHFGGRRFRLWSLWALLAGMLLGGLVVARGNLLPAIVAHTVINAAGLLRLARESAASRPGRDADGR